jgi:hypothetical protein
MLSQLGHPRLEFRTRIDGLLASPDLNSQPRVGYSRGRLQDLNPLERSLRSDQGTAIVLHNNIEFSVQEREAGIWRWEYTIGELIKSGELVVSSRVMASRKVRQQIDRDLRTLYRSQRERGV